MSYTGKLVYKPSNICFSSYHTLSLGAIVGIVIGVIAFLAICVVCIVIITKKKHRPGRVIGPAANNPQGAGRNILQLLSVVLALS